MRALKEHATVLVFVNKCRTATSLAEKIDLALHLESCARPANECLSTCTYAGAAQAFSGDQPAKRREMLADSFAAAARQGQPVSGTVRGLRVLVASLAYGRGVNPLGLHFGVLWDMPPDLDTVQFGGHA